MKRYISMRIDTNLLTSINEIRQKTRLSRTALIEEGLEMLIRLYTNPVNEREIRKMANSLISKREKLYTRLADK